PCPQTRRGAAWAWHRSRGGGAVMSRPDINDTLLNEGPDAVRRRHDEAHRKIEAVSLDDFYAYMPQHTYIFVPIREIWVAAGVNARIAPLDDGVDEKGEPKIIKATTWLDRNKPVEQMTWAPGEPMLIRDRLIAGGGWFERPGASCFNLYLPPAI